eukprot:587182-Lingulodinium_polyedra.AAC.1
MGHHPIAVTIFGQPSVRRFDGNPLHDALLPYARVKGNAFDWKNDWVPQNSSFAEPRPPRPRK